MISNSQDIELGTLFFFFVEPILAPFNLAELTTMINLMLGRFERTKG